MGDRLDVRRTPQQRWIPRSAEDMERGSEAVNGGRDRH